MGIDAVTDKLLERSERIKYPYVTFGIFGIITYPLYYLLWGYLAPIGYENLILRIIAVLFCIPLALKSYWPTKLQKYLTLYWYIALLYCLPFFFTYMTLINGVSYGWILNSLTGVVLSILLLDLVPLLIILPIGILLAWLCFHYFVGSVNYVNPLSINTIIIDYVAVIVFGALFAHNKQLLQEREILIRTEQAKAKQALIDCTAQVSHDIRSPLAALNTVLRDLPNMPEDQRILIRNAVRRINDIANNLLVEYRDEATGEKIGAQEQQKPATHNPELVSSLLDTLLSEKTAQMDDRSVELNLDIEPQAFGLFVKIDPIQFKRMISNLLNNAIEAVKETGNITVRMEKSGDQVRICLADTGQGMSPTVLNKVKHGGKTHGKKGGTGIGIASAINLVNQCGGHFDITSQVGKGTTVIVDLPTARTPEWFQEKLVLTSGTTVVVLDDDESIHAIWESRCQKFLSEITLKHFYRSQAFRDYCATADLSKTLFLADYELLGSEETGLDLIEQLELSKQAILVTSRHEEDNVRAQASKLKVKIIPKNFSPYIAISLAKNDQPRLVFLDDDKMLTRTWEKAAKIKGITIKTYNRISDFQRALPTLPKTTPIYIDSNLGESVSGETFAKELYDRGFTELYLASGYPRDHFGDLPWIKDFVSKEPPF